MYKIIIFEGLPKVGKTTLLNYIKNKKLANLVIAEELITQKAKAESSNTFDFMENDVVKINFAKEGLLLIDRGPISTLSYNQTKIIVDENYDFDIRKLRNWFNSFVPFFQQDNVFVYLLTQEDYRLRENEVLSSPHGTIENQKLMEQITFYNCKKYVKNLIVKEYSYDKMEEFADEIINKFMC